VALLGRACKAALRAIRGTSAAAMPDEALALSRSLPVLRSLPERARASKALLESLYGEYVAGVSSPAWAISLETASVLHALCRIIRPAAILDLGSGFSSAVFRIYARDAGTACLIRSVDDDAEWLERSRRFLASHDLPTNDLMLWPALDSTQAQYDLILHDSGNDTAVRAARLTAVLPHLSSRGFAVLDDMHSVEYAAFAAAACSSAGLRSFSLRHLTLDEYGRYARLAAR
jgi:predicted O-methyltransferase YrrM